MWIIKDGFLFDDEFPFFNLVSTKVHGDMKNESNREKVCSLKGVEAGSIVRAEQVHGGCVASVSSKDRGAVINGVDGLITAEKGIALVIFTADCLPVIIGAEGKACGVVHAGWRSLLKGVLPASVKLFKRKFNIAPEELAASVGPHICGGCYTVGAELRQSFGLSENASNFDLADEAVRQLKNEGLREIRVSKNCTMHEPERFFSHRKDKTPARIMTLAKL